MTLRSRLTTAVRRLRGTWKRRGAGSPGPADQVAKGKAQRDAITSTSGTTPPPTFPGQFR